LVDWQRATIEDLRQYNQKRQSLTNITRKIEALEEQMKSIRCGLKESEPVSGGGGSRSEDRLINCIAEKEKLLHNYRAVKGQVQILESALASLTDQERLVLERFYINRLPGYLERLMDELSIEKSELYRRKDMILRKLTTSLYGIKDF
jgi:DNA-directed RNA polymerase specialized sigma subunit